ncbi:MAG: BolA family transcriptional regulator [Planctomycetota bacterium]|nr:MAG: BolA family transcriptional regulator [Planctomycetota bacterium]
MGKKQNPKPPKQLEIKQIRNHLSQAFHPLWIEIRDFQEHHSQHVGYTGGAHLSLVIVSNFFQGMTPLERHRQIYKALEGWRNSIHALSLKTLTEEEALKHGVIQSKEKAKKF